MNCPSKHYAYEKSQALRVHFTSMSTHIHIIIVTVIRLEAGFLGFLKSSIQTVVHYILQQERENLTVTFVKTQT